MVAVDVDLSVASVKGLIYDLLLHSEINKTDRWIVSFLGKQDKYGAAFLWLRNAKTSRPLQAFKP